jgi:Pyridine nucleotide-disulphide oxidoreductase, dimerisation domain
MSGVLAGALGGSLAVLPALWWLRWTGCRSPARTGDSDLGVELLPVLDGVVKAHVAGTRYGVRVGDLLSQGEPGFALTWMGACGDGVGTALLVIDAARNLLVGATFTGPGVGELRHAATIAIAGTVPLERLRHAVPAFPTVSEVWLRLLEGLAL